MKIEALEARLGAAEISQLGGRLSDYQVRVVKEKADLDEKLAKLRLFCHGETFSTLPIVDQDHLNMQRNAMATYSAILGERIARFSPIESPCNAVQHD